MPNLLTLKSQNPGSYYEDGNIYDELGNEIATNVDAELRELSGKMIVDTSKSDNLGDSDEVESDATEVLGYDLAYHLLGTDTDLCCHANRIDQYINELWKGELCAC